ncbi:MAG: DnaJ domain-containing protein [Planctomycetota bacterium]
MDYYRTLDIEKGASRAEIRAAYLRLTAANHPDLNPDTDTSQRIREIHEAYEVLSDLKSRSAYDLNPDTFRESDVIYDGPRQEPQDFEPHPFQSHPASHRESFRKSPWADSHGTTQYNHPAGDG